MAEVLDLDEVKRRMEVQREAAQEAAQAALASRYSFIRPLDGSGYVTQVQTSDRFLLGIPAIDALTRGHGRKELTLVGGREASGKTQVVLNAINNNSDRHILMFTPDESPELVLAKLIAIRYGISSDELELRVKGGDVEAVKLVHDTAKVDFSRLIVIDSGLTIAEMGHALDEAEDYWQAKCDCAVYDYVDLLPGDSGYGGMTNKMRALKGWAKPADVPLLALHHTKKGEDSRGVSQGLDGLRYGGAAEAIIVLEVYRQRDNPKLTELERAGHKYSVTVRVVKNKRPPGRLGAVDLYINPNTGHIRTLTAEDRFRAGEPTTDAAVMLRSRKQEQ